MQGLPWSASVASFIAVFASSPAHFLSIHTEAENRACSQVLEYILLSLTCGTACYSCSKRTDFNLGFIFFSKSFPSGLVPLLCSPIAGNYLLLPHNTFVTCNCNSWFSLCLAPIYLTVWKQVLCLFCSLLMALSPSRVLALKYLWNEWTVDIINKMVYDKGVINN